MRPGFDPLETMSFVNSNTSKPKTETDMGFVNNNTRKTKIKTDMGFANNSEHTLTPMSSGTSSNPTFGDNSTTSPATQTSHQHTSLQTGRDCPSQTPTLTTSGTETVGTHTTTKMSDVNDREITLKTECFNCHGFKQSANYITKHIKQCDFMLLSETWLWPHELTLIDKSICDSNSSDDFKVFSKSSMCNVESDYCGRPFGGLAIIAKVNVHYSCFEIPTDCDRLLVVEVKDNNGTLLQVLCNIYMPYFDRSKKEQIAIYVEVIDVLQSILDKYAAIAPVQLLGDFNTRLPISAVLHKNWHKHKSFNE